MNEPWVRVHANLRGKPVIARAVAALGVSENEAMGLMVSFWGQVSQHVVNGFLTGTTDRQLEVWAGWTRKRGRFAAFIKAHHMDANGRVNEWDEYAGKLEARRARDRERKEEERARKSGGRPKDNPQDVTGDSIPTRANETTRDVTSTPVVVLRSVRVDSIEERATADAAADYATKLTVAANRAITARWGEQTRVLMAGQSYEIVSVLMDAGITIDEATESIRSQCEKSSKAFPPKSINWFRDGIIDAMDQKAARAMAASMPTPDADDPFGLKRWARETDARESENTSDASQQSQEAKTA
jgi:hypothetical protein